MDVLADTGSRWFCTAAHAVGTASLEMQACGNEANRYAIGLATAMAVAILLILSAWRLLERDA